MSLLRIGLLSGILALRSTSAFSQATFQPGMMTGQLFIHDPSTIAREHNRYWVFGTGPGLRARWSSNLVNWVEGSRVFDAPPAWTTNAVPGFRGHFWAPDVLRVNGKWHLYYAVSTFGKQTSAIGLVTNPTLDPGSTNYAWTDQGPVIQSHPGDEFNAIDPSLMLEADGRLWMAFGSYWRGIFLCELDPRTGLRRDPKGPPQRLAWHDSIEAACLLRNADHYYLFVNWGQCCRGTNSTYEVRVGRSEKIAGPYLDREGRKLLAGGGSLFLSTSGRFVGPGHLGRLTDGAADWFSFHYYDAGDKGRPHLALGELEWSGDGWPRAKNPLGGSEPKR